ncbi:Mce protein [Mycobacterium sp. 852002-51057_SCH5723018]|nr:Mce protein [Mycobacterium sp. 852002-51057_SCH5723018]
MRRRRSKIDQNPAVAADQATEATTEDSQESEGGAEETSPEATTEVSQESEDAAEETSPEATTEGSQGSEDAAQETSPEATTEDAAESEDAAQETAPEATTQDAAESEDAADAVDTGDGRRPSRLGRGWLAGIAAALVLGAAALGAGGYFALRYHHQSQAIARNDAAALKAAVDCVSATQAPDTNAMTASEQKIIDCGTDAFRSQAVMYTNMIVQAYQAANVHVQVSDVRAAVERNNNDGSIDVLVAMRVKVASDQSQNETGYRLRVTMALAEGEYRISKLIQVTK